MTTEQLIERLEKLEGPCRKTDALIWKACFSIKYDEAFWLVRGMQDRQLTNEQKDESARQILASRGPKFTSSLDAADTTWPEDWRWAKMELRGDGQYAVLGARAAPPYRSASGVHKDHRIALCIAALRAQMMEESEG